MSINYPNIEELIGGYFHQDWDTYADTAAGVLEFYLHEWPTEYILQTLVELRLLLQRGDDELEAEVLKMGCEYNPPGDNTTYRDWLNRMAARLSAHVGIRVGMGSP